MLRAIETICVIGLCASGGIAGHALYLAVKSHTPTAENVFVAFGAVLLFWLGLIVIDALEIVREYRRNRRYQEGNHG